MQITVGWFSAQEENAKQNAIIVDEIQEFFFITGWNDWIYLSSAFEFMTVVDHSARKSTSRWSPFA